MSKEKGFQTKYSPEFKLSVIMDMRENHLSYRATEKKYNLFKMSVKRWERIYLEEGAAGDMHPKSWTDFWRCISKCVAAFLSSYLNIFTRERGKGDIDITDNSSYNNSVAKLNPFRYRGYYYDTETGLYYLNSRYYDPSVGRFINADDISYI